MLYQVATEVKHNENKKSYYRLEVEVRDAFLLAGNVFFFSLDRFEWLLYQLKIIVIEETVISQRCPKELT